MPSKAILREAQYLRDIGQRLEVLADQHDGVTEALLTITATAQNTPALLEVIVATKLDGSRPI